MRNKLTMLQIYKRQYPHVSSHSVSPKPTIGKSLPNKSNSRWNNFRVNCAVRVEECRPGMWRWWTALRSASLLESIHQFLYIHRNTMSLIDFKAMFSVVRDLIPQAQCSMSTLFIRVFEKVQYDFCTRANERQKQFMSVVKLAVWFAHW